MEETQIAGDGICETPLVSSRDHHLDNGHHHSQELGKSCLTLVRDASLIVRLLELSKNCSTYISKELKNFHKCKIHLSKCF